MPNTEDFKETYLKYSDKIFRYFYWRTRDMHTAEDLTSEVFTKAWQAWGKMEPDYVQAWLYKIAHNLLVDSYRKKKELPLKEGGEAFYDDDLTEKVARDQRIAELSEALGKLPENLRSIVILRFMEELSAKEVGKILELSEVNVRVLQHRALIKLKEILKNER